MSPPPAACPLGSTPVTLTRDPGFTRRTNFLLDARPFAMGLLFATRKPAIFSDVISGSSVTTRGDLCCVVEMLGQCSPHSGIYPSASCLIEYSRHWLEDSDWEGSSSAPRNPRATFACVPRSPAPGRAPAGSSMAHSSDTQLGDMRGLTHVASTAVPCGGWAAA